MRFSGFLGYDPFNFVDMWLPTKPDGVTPKNTLVLIRNKL